MNDVHTEFGRLVSPNRTGEKSLRGGTGVPASRRTRARSLPAVRIKGVETFS